MNHDDETPEQTISRQRLDACIRRYEAKCWLIVARLRSHQAGCQCQRCVQARAARRG